MHSNSRDLLALGLQSGSRRRARMPRRALGLALLASPVIAGLSGVLPELSHARTQGSALVEVLAGGKRSETLPTLTVGTNARLVFAKPLGQRVAIGDDEVVQLDPTSVGQRDLLLIATAVGRTTLTVWFADDTVEQLVVRVQRDLSVLESALARIHPAIQAEIAPDRDAIVLAGTVPERSFSVAAENAAALYLEAGSGGARAGGPIDPDEVRGGDEAGRSGQVINLIRVEEHGASLEDTLARQIEQLGGEGVAISRVQRGALPDDRADAFVLEGSLASTRALANVRQLLEALLEPRQVVNRLTVAGLTMDVAGVIQSAIRDELGCPEVEVSSVSQMRRQGEADVLVLRGSVPSQTKLTQTLALASRLFLQQDLVQRKAEGEFEEITEVLPSGTTRTTRRPLRLKPLVEDLVVTADESGALFLDRPLDAAQGVGRLGRNAGGGGGSGGSSSSFGDLLSNGIATNVGRARALELAEGRILSFLTVDDLPQVRVDVRLYEVNRQALVRWNPRTRFQSTDFELPSRLRRANVDADGELLPGAPATDDEDVSNLLRYMQGILSNEFAISGNHTDLSVFFELLEREGIARSISNPTLTVMSGEVAGFGVGGRIPINETTVTGTGFATGNVGFVEFGVNLAVRPLVGEGDWITLDVVPEVSNPDAALTAQLLDSTGTPPPTTAFASRVLRTTSRLRDGESLLLGGLSQFDRSDSSGETPFLHRIPLLGWLFKDFDYSDSDKDLVVVVHPVIVRDRDAGAPLWSFPSSEELLRPTPSKLPSAPPAAPSPATARAEAPAGARSAR